MNLFGQHSDKAELLLLSWAYKHPYLYTFIETMHEAMNPTLYVVIIFAGFKVMGAMGRANGWRKR